MVGDLIWITQLVLVNILPLVHQVQLLPTVLLILDVLMSQLPVVEAAGILILLPALAASLQAVPHQLLVVEDHPVAPVLLATTG